MISKLLGIVIVLVVCLVMVCSLQAAESLPDTGQTKFYNNSTEIGKPTPGASFYGQDAHYNSSERKHSYTKLDENGNDLPFSANTWQQVRDNVTGLIWEVKQDKDGTPNYTNPNDADNKYTWYDSHSDTNGGNAGTPGNDTDTEDFLGVLNSVHGFCGHTDWRLPTVTELSSLVDSGLFEPSINPDYFRRTTSSSYWTSTTSKMTTAWCVNFGDGYVTAASKTDNHDDYARAVRTGQSRPCIPLMVNHNNPDITEDDTVTDPNTGLMWQRYVSSRMTWQEALTHCERMTLAGYSDWRLPDRNELQSLIDYDHINPALNSEDFPQTLPSSFWSSTSRAKIATSAWRVDFYSGQVVTNYKSRAKYVRAVRSAQLVPLNPNDIDNDCDGYTENQGDCNDNNASVYPGAQEICGDSLDNNCNGYIDEGCNDIDHDGYTVQDDCNDNDPLIHPGAPEICGDGIDNNCNGMIDENCSVPIPSSYHMGSYNYYLPYFISGDYWTGLGLANQSHTSSDELLVTVYDSNGYSIAREIRNIPAYGQDAFSVAPQLNTSGWMQVNTHQEMFGLAFLGGGSVPLLMADIPFTSELSSCLVVPHIAQDDKWDTTILICNPNSENVSVRLIYVDKTGAIQGTKSYNILPHGSGAYLLSEVFDDKIPLAGRVEINSSAGLAAFALYTDKKSGGSYYAGINAESCE